MTAYSDLHSGVAALKASRGGRVCPLQLFETVLCSVNRGGTASNFAPGQFSAVRGLFCLKVRGTMKKILPYLCISAIIFLIPLLFLFIGFISPARSGSRSPFVRMTVCTVLGFLLTALITRYIHPVTGLAGLDSAWLNLGFTIAILLALFVEFVTFGNSTVAPYMAELADRNKDGAGESFYSCIKYVFMGGQLLVAVRTFIHSAFLGLLKAIMKHAD